ncbi:hypothetical protein VTN77DRAFT_7338 [Rasamsonia byssochlamydoides]|uniref:uncharacterized protein n=1 Tax=Rasamsonia byssochlamydoides TaxID=89139 RepID=UPI0037448016
MDTHITSHQIGEPTLFSNCPHLQHLSNQLSNWSLSRALYLSTFSHACQLLLRLAARVTELSSMSTSPKTKSITHRVVSSLKASFLRQGAISSSITHYLLTRLAVSNMKSIHYMRDLFPRLKFQLPGLFGNPSMPWSNYWRTSGTAQTQTQWNTRVRMYKA